MADPQLVVEHGGQGSQEASFTRLLRKDIDYKPLALSNPDAIFKSIAEVMDQGVDTASDQPDDQENPFVPAGYTYLGQFVDHDLTFDTRSTLDTLGRGQISLPDDERTPRLDMDCLYGEGPSSSAFMYDVSGKLLTNPDKPFDLPRAANPFTPGDATSHRAIIGDPRNDENSIVCQLQLAFIHLHNAMIDHFAPSTPKNKLFETAQREVRFTYQNIVVTDLLKRVIQKKVYDDFLQTYQTSGTSAFKLYKPGPIRNALPLEFTGAAYRFGHSQVRNAYRLNADFQRLIFDGLDDSAESLVGFGDLPQSHQIDWKLFVTNTLAPGDKAENKDGAPADKTRLQFAYKLDTSLVDPLAHLPPRIAGDVSATFQSLAARNLKRGYNFGLPSGQDIAKALGLTNHPPLLIGDKLVAFDKLGLSAADAKALQNYTPLWLYVLAEAQASQLKADGKFPTNSDGSINKDPNQGTQLGPVGGRILLEVFFGLLDTDLSSFVHDKSWSPVIKPGAKALTLWDMLNWIKVV